MEKKKIRFRCQSVRKFKIRFEEDSSLYYEAEFYAVNEGNQRAHGSLRIGPMKDWPVAFEVGKEYYIEISEVE